MLSRLFTRSIHCCSSLYSLSCSSKKFVQEILEHFLKKEKKHGKNYFIRNRKSCQLCAWASPPPLSEGRHLVEARKKKKCENNSTECRTTMLQAVDWCCCCNILNMAFARKIDRFSFSFSLSLQPFLLRFTHLYSNLMLIFHLTAFQSGAAQHCRETGQEAIWSARVELFRIHRQSSLSPWGRLDDFTRDSQQRRERSFEWNVDSFCVVKLYQKTFFI